MRPVVPYRERTRSIFCANCGAVVVDAMPVKDAETLARTGFTLHCATCAVPNANIEDCEKKMVALRQAHQIATDLREKAFNEELIMLSAQIEVQRGTLASIALERKREYGYKAANN